MMSTRKSTASLASALAAHSDAPQASSSSSFSSAFSSPSPLRLSKLTLALASMGLGLAASGLMTTTVLAAPNITVVQQLERSTSNTASMCFTFSQGQSVLNDADNLSRLIELRQLKPAGTNSQDMVSSLVPAQPAVDQGLFCLTGLQPGANYEVNFKRGLAFTSGNKLASDQRTAFTISNATSQIKLPYNIVLPKNAQNTSFNVQTINQPSFKLAIFKLSSRSITQLNLQELLSNNIEGWALHNLIANHAHKVYEGIFNVANGSNVVTYGANERQALGQNLGSGGSGGMASDSASNRSSNSSSNSSSTSGKRPMLGKASFGKGMAMGGGDDADSAASGAGAVGGAGAGGAAGGIGAGAAGENVSPAMQEALAAKLSAQQMNRPLNTTVELRDFVQKGDDGMYILVATDPRVDLDFRDMSKFEFLQNTSLPVTAKLMMITDLGLSTYKSTDGILVNVRSLTTAQSLPGVHLSLVAQNNEILATATTNEQGTVRFPRNLVSGRGALAPRAIVAAHDQDNYSLDLQSSPLYIEDNKGSHHSNNVLYNDPDTTLGQDAYETFAYTERGIYRPKEKVHYTALVRDHNLKGVTLPLTLKVMGPYSNTMVKTLLTEPKMGGYEYDFELPQGAPFGQYAIVLQLGDSVLERTPFTVGSFLPSQINSDFLNTEKMIALNRPFKVRSVTNFNYGAHAPDLNGNFTMRLMPDPQPVANEANAANNEFLDKYHFGPDSRRYAELTQVEQFYDLQTDAEGVLQTDVTVKPSDFPRIARITSSVNDTNGQALAINKTFKVAHTQPLIGVRLLNAEADSDGSGNSGNSTGSSNGAAASGATTNFSLCSYMQDGSTFPQEVKYYIYKEFHDYNYVYQDERWQYVSFVGRNLVGQGTARIDNRNLDKAAITTDLQDGSYVIELKSDKSQTTYSFVKGFASSESALTPDRVAIYSDKEQYDVGDTATLTFDSPFAGYANLALGSSSISDFQTFKVNRGSNTIQVKITDDFSPQGHALLSIFSPLPNNRNRGNDEGSANGAGGMGTGTGSISSAATPIRAVGLCDLNLNLNSHKLQVTTNAPEEIKPESTLQLTVTAMPQDGSAPRSKGDTTGYAKVTLVDNGVLSLTNYKAPEPNDAIMRDHAYDVNLYDAYGLLIRNPQQQGQGYGASADEALKMDATEAATALEALPFKTVALASKIVPLDSRGQGEVAFDIPAFAGSVKVMSVAWNDEQTGATADDVLVRDQAVATLGLPRFLNAGDTVKARLNLHNIKASTPDFKIDVSCSGSLKCSYQSTSNLKPGLREDHFFDVKTYSSNNQSRLGVGQIRVKVINPEFNVQQSYDLTVTSPHLPILRNYLKQIPAQGSASIKLDRFSQLRTLSLSKSPLPYVNPIAYITQIDRFGQNNVDDLVASLESKLLYGDLLIDPAGYFDDGSDSDNAPSRETYDNLSPQLNGNYLYHSRAELNSAIQDLITRILARENNAGGFIGGAAYEYTNANTTRVLLLAQEKGFMVNPEALEKALQTLRTQCKNFYYNSSAAPYANEVLSTHENINQANLRVALDENRVKAPVMLAHLANALANINDHARAQQALEKACNGLLTWQQLQDDLSKIPTDQGDKMYPITSKLNELNVVNGSSLRRDAYIVLDACLREGLQEQAEMLLSKIRVLQSSPDYIPTQDMVAILRANAHATANGEGNGSANVGSFVLNQSQRQSLLKAMNSQPAKSSNKGKGKGKGKSANANANADNAPAQTANNTPIDENELHANANEYAIKGSEVEVYNNGDTPIFATLSAWGQYGHDKVIANKGLHVNVNYFNRDGTINPAEYTFRPNEEMLMEVHFYREVSSETGAVVKVKLPAGFEFVRKADKEDPTFRSLLKDIPIIYYVEDLQVADDMITAKYSPYMTDNSISLFLVLRATQPGTFSQGEALVQMLKNPQVYGTYFSTSPLKVK